MHNHYLARQQMSQARICGYDGKLHNTISRAPYQQPLPIRPLATLIVAQHEVHADLDHLFHTRERDGIRGTVQSPMVASYLAVRCWWIREFEREIKTSNTMRFSISLLSIPGNLPLFLLLNWIPTRSVHIGILFSHVVPAHRLRHLPAIPCWTRMKTFRDS